jgi:hypothetical protein
LKTHHNQPLVGLEPKQILTTIKILIKANELEASWQLTPFQILFLLSNFIKKKTKKKEKEIK